MAVEIVDAIDVRERLTDLQCVQPTQLAILPTNLERASSAGELMQQSEAATIRALFRTANITCEEVSPPGARLPYVQNNSFEWVGPTLFVGAGLLSGSQNTVSVALSVLSNYLTDFLRGIPGGGAVKLDIVVEKTRTKTYKRVVYEGDPEGLKALGKVIKDVASD